MHKTYIERKVYRHEFRYLPTGPAAYSKLSMEMSGLSEETV